MAAGAIWLMDEEVLCTSVSNCFQIIANYLPLGSDKVLKPRYVHYHGCDESSAVDVRQASGEAQLRRARFFCWRIDTTPFSKCFGGNMFLLAEAEGW